MTGVYAGNFSVILHAKIYDASICVCKRYHSLKKFSVRIFLFIAFEFSVYCFLTGYGSLQLYHLEL